jgi:hypothetical protein
LSSARTVSSSRDFGVEQFFRADEFRAVDPSPNCLQKKEIISLAYYKILTIYCVIIEVFTCVFYILDYIF